MRVLEIGCGDIPHIEDGWEHLDIRPLPHIEHVQDATNLGNIPDCTFDRVVSRNCIEHIGWRDTLRTLSEWLRVLKPGGVLELETTNAEEFIPILRGQSTETKMDEPNWVHFNRVAYGHQDYPENTHKSYFTPDWLIGLLISAGFESVETMWRTQIAFRLLATRG